MSQINEALDRLGHRKFKLTILGCRTCFHESDIYDTDPNLNAINILCVSLQIMCPISFASPLLGSIKDMTNLECFKIRAIDQNSYGESGPTDEDVRNMLPGQPHRLRDLGVIDVGILRVDNSKHQALKCLKSCTLYDGSTLSRPRLLNLLSSLENLSTLKWVRPHLRYVGRMPSHLQHLYLEKGYIGFFPTQTLDQLTTLKLPIDHAQAGGTIGRRKR
ncbi:14513_t:CDS:2, partial [Acaulospora colombiana]